MNEQSSAVSVELEHTHNNSPSPHEERGAGGLQFASPLPQSLAFSRASLIQRKHPRQNKTSAICSISPCFPATKQMIINWSLLSVSGAPEHLRPKYQLSDLETFYKSQASCFFHFPQ